MQVTRFTAKCIGNGMLKQQYREFVNVCDLFHFQAVVRGTYVYQSSLCI